MSRQIVLDTETTGLSAENGDRVIELGCVELLNRKPSGNDLHIYFNPGRESHEDALKVHGLTSDFADLGGGLVTSIDVSEDSKTKGKVLHNLGNQFNDENHS